MFYNEILSKTKYKVALVTDYFLPRLGGIESQLRDLAFTLSEKGHKVRVITATPDNSTYSLKMFENGYFTEKVGKYHVDRVITRLPFAFPNSFNSQKLIESILQGSDIVHIHVGVISPFSHKIVDLALSMGKPVLVTWHCILGAMEQYCKQKLDVKTWVEHGAVMTAVSSVHAKELEKTFGVEFKVLNNAIDCEKWNYKYSKSDLENVSKHSSEKCSNSNKYYGNNIFANNEECFSNVNETNSLENLLGECESEIVPALMGEGTSKNIVNMCASMRFTFRKRVLHLIKIFFLIDREFKKRSNAGDILLKKNPKEKTGNIRRYTQKFLKQKPSVYSENNNDFLSNQKQYVNDSKNMKAVGYHLFLYGEGTLFPIVKILIYILGLSDKITLMGRKDKTVLMDQYRKSDIYIVTCLTESFGIAALDG